MSIASPFPFESTLYVRDTCLCFQVQRAGRALARRFDEAFRPVGLTNGQFSLLNALNRPQPPTLGAVAQTLGLRPHHPHRSAQAACRAGFCRRRARRRRPSRPAPQAHRRWARGFWLRPCRSGDRPMQRLKRICRRKPTAPPCDEGWWRWPCECRPAAPTPVFVDVQAVPAPSRAVTSTSTFISASIIATISMVAAGRISRNTGPATATNRIDVRPVGDVVHNPNHIADVRTRFDQRRSDRFQRLRGLRASAIGQAHPRIIIARRARHIDGVAKSDSAGIAEARLEGRARSRCGVTFTARGGSRPSAFRTRQCRRRPSSSRQYRPAPRAARACAPGRYRNGGCRRPGP